MCVPYGIIFYYNRCNRLCFAFFRSGSYRNCGLELPWPYPLKRPPTLPDVSRKRLISLSPPLKGSRYIAHMLCLKACGLDRQVDSRVAFGGELQICILERDIVEAVHGPRRAAENYLSPASPVLPNRAHVLRDQSPGTHQRVERFQNGRQFNGFPVVFGWPRRHAKGLPQPLREGIVAAQTEIEASSDPRVFTGLAGEIGAHFAAPNSQPRYLCESRAPHCPAREYPAAHSQRPSPAAPFSSIASGARLSRRLPDPCPLGPAAAASIAPHRKSTPAVPKNAWPRAPRAGRACLPGRGPRRSAAQRNVLQSHAQFRPIQGRGQVTHGFFRMQFDRGQSAGARKRMLAGAAPARNCELRALEESSANEIAQSFQCAVRLGNLALRYYDVEIGKLTQRNIPVGLRSQNRPFVSHPANAARLQRPKDAE